MGFIKTQLRKNKVLLKDNLILFVTIFLANLINYFFHFYVGRTLGPEDYGVFGVLLSLVYIIVFPLMAIQTTISKFVAELNIHKEKEKIAYLFSKSFKKIGLVGLGIGVIFILLSPLLASFLKIDVVSPLIILGISIVFAFLIPILRGLLQGLQNFRLLGITFISESLTKLFIGVPLIYLGFGVNGAIGGFALSFFIPLLVLFYFIRGFFRDVKEKFNTSQIYRYSFPVLIMLLSLTGFYTLDIILVKRFFNPIDAGYYAALSLLGKVIFFASMSIAMVMFPKVSEFASQNKNSKSLLMKSLLIVLGLGLVASLFYFSIPNFIIGLLFGKDYLIIAPLLGLFGIVMTVYSLVYVLSYYLIALNKNKFLYILIFFNLIEVGLISIFHENLMSVVISLISVMVLLFLSLIAYTIKNDKSINNYSGI
ncbi:hypothetical protein CMI37_20210 [Candidatus Pacearchaeota archaeon]|nr:hypothetical protein [Candidatus Pacearchaeota archaeon]